MQTKTSKGKEIRIPGPDHPITSPTAEGKVRVTVAERIVTESTRALRLEEKGYPPVYYLPWITPSDAATPLRRLSRSSTLPPMDLGTSGGT